MTDPNVELRTAREALPSPTFAREPMSRAELAEAVNAELWRTTGRGYGLDAHSIARYERGAVRWPGSAYRSALRAVLGVATDAELGFVPTRRGSAVESVAPLGCPDDPLHGLTVRSPIPAGIGWTDVEHVRATTRALALSENLFGGGLACEAAAAQLRWTTGLLSARAGREVRTALVEAIGNLAGVVAFAAFDIADHASAERCFRFALGCAEESGSWALRSNTLADMARQAAHLGRCDDALSLVELAQVRSDRISATARAMTSAQRGKFLALAGRTTEAAEEVARADEWMAASDPGLDPPWLCYYDLAEHQGSTARALITIARHTGDPEPAVRRLGKQASLVSDQYPRSRAFARVRLATLLVTTGDTDRAAGVGWEALREARDLHSDRIRNELTVLARACNSQRGDAAANDLGRAIGALPR